MEVSTIYLRVSPLPVESERSVVRRRGQALSQFSTLSLLLRIIRLRLNKSVDTNQKRHYNIYNIWYNLRERRSAVVSL